MQVEGEVVADAEVSPGDLLIVDRSQEAQDQSLVVGVIEGQLVVLRVQQEGQHLYPVQHTVQDIAGALEIWGVVSYVIHRA
jgi:DNA polymerase V